MQLAHVYGHTTKHEGKRQSIFNCFDAFCKSSMKYKDLMKEVVHKGKKMAILYRSCAESYKEDTFDNKAKVANRVISDFAAQMKMKKGGNYQPNSQAQLIRTLIAYMHDNFEWNFSIDRDFKQEKGGLPAVLSKLFQTRKENDDTGTVSFVFLFYFIFI